LAIAVGFVVRKEEQLVLLDRPANGSAQLVQILERLRDAVLIVEPIVGREIVVAVVPVRISVE
jgi:hypothetical protein